MQSLEPAVMMDKFPKSQVDVYAYVLENDGGSLAAAITAASLALIDASIEMYDMVAACNIRLHGKVINSMLENCFFETMLKISGCGLRKV